MIRRAFLAALLVGFSLSLGCGDPNSSKPAINAAPVGVQSTPKQKGRTMPAPPPVEKIN